ncbi:MAG TPA: PstS family phosphate ABC transporter substrate-binding protein [Planctomycetaceae bacterium]|jgi:phosphate transport system substrate-binding protein|nr:PstS family phosphate ABC transporter substrate-binding protein [Planctomycetaceae bacterium]
MSHCPVAVLWVRSIVLAALAGTSAGCQIRDAELPPDSAQFSQSSGSHAGTAAERADSSQPLRGRITIDGSSTVYVITQAVTEEFLKAHRQVRVTLGRAGTGGGFKRFDVDDLDICDASRPIEPEEIEACRQNGVHYLELKIALDGLTVVVNPQNTWCRALTVAQLKQIWESGSTVTYWNQIDAAWPATKILLYGPDTDSGTFEYFTEVVCGKRGNCRTDYQQSSDDNFLVQGVQGDTGALGYFGYAYAVLNRDSVKAIPIAAGSNAAAAVVPNEATIASGEYAPLSRPLFLYVNLRALRRPEVVAYLNFYLDRGPGLAAEVHSLPLPQAQYAETRAQLARAEAASAVRTP